MTENKPDPLMSLLINHDVFPLAPQRRDVLYSALKAYIETKSNESRQDYHRQLAGAMYPRG